MISPVDLTAPPTTAQPDESPAVRASALVHDGVGEGRDVNGLTVDVVRAQHFPDGSDPACEPASRPVRDSLRQRWSSPLSPASTVMRMTNTFTNSYARHTGARRLGGPGFGAKLTA
jgi:hypothetical protein